MTFGNIIYSPITNSIMPSGIYHDSLIMDSFADGIYFVHLKLGHKKTIIKKIIKSSTANLIDNKNGIANVSIYPNPTRDKQNIKYSYTNNNKIAIFDVTGKLLFNSEKRLEIDISHLQSGFYYLQLQNECGNETFKIIKE